VPAVLTLVGGLHIYLFGVEAKNRIVVGYCVFLFSLFLFYGVQEGAIQREYERADRLERLSEQEKQIRMYRLNLGLPEEVPNWITTGEPK
jgi:hypothetical protein